MNSKRPVNLNIATIKLPLPAYTSILHRLSGIGLFIAAGMALYGLQLSLASAASFAALKTLLASPLIKGLVWLILSALSYHFIAGIKHLLLDIDIGDGQLSGHLGAILTLVLATVLISLTGLWLW